MWRLRKDSNPGLVAALLSAMCMGVAPVFGKQAMLLGMPALGVVAARTIIAFVLLLGIILVFKRRFLFISSAGMTRCLAAGTITG